MDEGIRCHVQFGWGGGMEHQTSTFVVNIGESLYCTQVGHQWFGDKTTCGSWKMFGSMKLLQHTCKRSMYMERNTLPTQSAQGKVK